VSIEVALLSAVIATVLGTAASLGIASMSRRSRLLVTNITYIPVVNPEIITGISLMLLFVAYQRFAEGVSWLPDTIMGFPTLLIAHIAFNVPYVIFNVSPKLKQLDIKLYEAALDLGCQTHDTRLLRTYSRGGVTPPTLVVRPLVSSYVRTLLTTTYVTY